jgi:broad specificity phosphatase PhoE
VTLGRFGPAIPTRVIFVRHGNVHNPANIIYGRLPRMRLSARGHEDMDRTARYLADVPLAAIYTSPLLRARQSAAYLARVHPGVPLRITQWLIEVHTSWQGESNAITGQTPGFSYYDPPKGEGDETIQQVFDRMNQALRMVLRRHPGQTSVCVSHGDPIKILRIGYAGKELTPDHVRAPDPGQASLVTFDFWHPDALPIISAVDFSQLEHLIAGDHLRPRPPAPPEPSTDIAAEPVKAAQPASSANTASSTGNR